MTPHLRPVSERWALGFTASAFGTVTHRALVSCALCVAQYWEASFAGDECQATKAGFEVYKRLTHHLRSAGGALDEDQFALTRWAVSQGAIKARYCDQCDAFHFAPSERSEVGCPYCSLSAQHLLPPRVRGYIENARPSVATDMRSAVGGDVKGMGAASGHAHLLPIHCVGA